MANVTSFIKENIGVIGAGAGGLALGGTVGYLAASGNRSKKRKSKSKRKSVRKKRYHRQKLPHTAGRRKDKSTRRIRYTKNNQPYVIMASGKARFIKKSSVRNSRKRKGGRY